VSEPSYDSWFSDLRSVNVVDQEIDSFEAYYKEMVYSLVYGSSVEIEVRGGTNFWNDFDEKY
jgi:hypothetical protein